MKSIFDRAFHYTPSFETDLKKTFARSRREQREADAQAEQPQPTAPAQKQQKVLPIGAHKQTNGR